MRAVWNGTVIAESEATVVVGANHYFPSDTVGWDLLSATDRTSTYPWKGQARYWSVDDGDRHAANVASPTRSRRPPLARSPVTQPSGAV